MLLGVLFGFLFFSHDNAQSTQVVTVPQPAAETQPASQPVESVTEQPGSAVTTPPPPAPTTVFIPTVGIRTSIIEAYLDGVSWDVDDLGTNAGHLQGTAWLDRPGNVVLAGHAELADGRRGVFARVGEVNPGDPIFVRHGNDERQYIVRDVFMTTPDDLTVLYPTTQEQLTLITCDSYDFLQDAYLQRMVVIAERIA